MVEVTTLSYFIVGFIDCVEEVGGYDEHVDASSVLDEARGARLGFRVAGADCEVVVETLDPPCYQLEDVSILV